MLRAATRYLRDRVHRRSALLLPGFPWPSTLAFDAILVLAAVIATLQRPDTDLPAALAAGAVAVAPQVVYFVSDLKVNVALMWACLFAATTIFLFATSAPIRADIAPLLLALMVGLVLACSTVLAGVLAAASATVLLVVASALHRLDALALYLALLAMGWMVGYILLIQQRLMSQQNEAQAALAQHAAADERRRIAREVHDVIAHSLSVTLLHVTGARRGLQQDRDVDDAVEALQQAECLGRAAMADIRRTVGLLDDAPMKMAPEPGIGDIPRLVDDFIRAGLKLALTIHGPTSTVSGALGLELYRITQESLANIAKHAPESNSTAEIGISQSSATLRIVNDLPAAAAAATASEGRGLRGMRQRAELLNGVIHIGPVGDQWTVCADIPLSDFDDGRPAWSAAS